MFQLNSTKVRRFVANLAALAVGAVAARATWDHIAHVGVKYGEPMAAWLPVSVDGMMIAGVLLVADAAAVGRRPNPWARVAAWTGGLLSIAAQIESGRERGLIAALIATVFSITLIITVEALFHRARIGHRERPAESLISAVEDAMAEVEAPNAVAFRAAQQEMRKQSRLDALNGK